MDIRKAVFPVGGLGTRFLPASKAIPKAMFPLVDKPILQYDVEEAIKFGIKEIIFVTGPETGCIEDHFSQSPKLEAILQRKGKHMELEKIRGLSELASYVSVTQSEPLGLGSAILCARELVGGEPFMVILGDDVIDPDTPCLPDMINIHKKYAGSVLSLYSVPIEEVSAYGVASVEELKDGTLRVSTLVEKPTPEQAPSNLIVIGRYILTPDIFEKLERVSPGIRGEVQLTDAIIKQVEEGKCYALKFRGKFYDTGTPLGLLKTSITYALKRPDIATGLREYLRHALEQE